MNTFDLIGAVELTASAAVVVATLASAIGRSPIPKLLVAAGFAAWFFLLVGLAGRGLFDADRGTGVPAIGPAVLLPVVALSLACARIPSWKAAVAEIPAPILIGVNAVRVLGVSFVLLYSAGRLPAPFAPVAGWGDILVGVAALPVAWMAAHRTSGFRTAVLVWNSLGLLDLVAAVVLGLTSAPGSPLRLFVAEPGTRIMGTLPWVLIPGFLVPNLMLTHFALFSKLRQAAAWPQRMPRGEGRTPDGHSPSPRPA